MPKRIICKRGLHSPPPPLWLIVLLGYFYHNRKLVSLTHEILEGGNKSVDLSMCHDLRHSMVVEIPGISFPLMHHRPGSREMCKSLPPTGMDGRKPQIHTVKGELYASTHTAAGTRNKCEAEPFSVMGTASLSSLCVVVPAEP